MINRSVTKVDLQLIVSISKVPTRYGSFPFSYMFSFFISFSYSYLALSPRYSYIGILYSDLFIDTIVPLISTMDRGPSLHHIFLSIFHSTSESTLGSSRSCIQLHFIFQIEIGRGDFSSPLPFSLYVRDYTFLHTGVSRRISNYLV